MYIRKAKAGFKRVIDPFAGCGAAPHNPDLLSILNFTFVEKYLRDEF
jgi:hypothetical protein